MKDKLYRVMYKLEQKRRNELDKKITEAILKEGTKYDNGKPPVAEFLLDFAPEIMEVAKVWKFGADKYAKSNWKKVENGKERYMNALMRHLLQSETEPVDPESGMSHLVHVVFNALAVLHFEKTDNILAKSTEKQSK